MKIWEETANIFICTDTRKGDRGMNKVILMGRLTHEPELKQTPGGVSVASFSIAVNRRFAKEGKQDADFINCVAWRQTGEFISRYFHKGSMIAVAGSIQTRSWEGTDGKRQYAAEVVVDEAYFTGEKKQETQERLPTTALFDDFAPADGEDLPF